MSLGKVSVSFIDQFGGAVNEVDNVFLFVGKPSSSVNNKKLLSISASSDLGDLLGRGDSLLKTQIEYAISNSQDSSFSCYALGIDPDTDDVYDEIDKVIAPPNDAKIEAVFYTEPIESQAEIVDFNNLISNIQSKYAKYITAHLSVSPIADGETYTDYVTRLKGLISGLVAENVALVPQLEDNILGVIAGRLANVGTSIADSPIKVSTGALKGIVLSKVDDNGDVISFSQLEELCKERFSVPQYYPNYDGLYWGGHPMLTAEGSSWNQYEQIRVAQKVARIVRIKMIQKIGDRSLNNTPFSLKVHQMDIERVLRDLSVDTTIGNRVIVGVLRGVEDGDVQITFPQKGKACVALLLRLYDVVKQVDIKIAVNIGSEDIEER